MIEEVSFRGALDGHVYHHKEVGGIWTAVLITTLWGLWHVPLAIGSAPVIALIVPHVLAHSAIGIPLSIYSRRSGNLLVPGAAHAFVKAIRNGLE